MRLLNIHSLRFTEFSDEGRPAYVAASHRWRLGDEATFHDVYYQRNTDSQGYKKVEAFARYIRDHLRPTEWLWIDTCCIRKDSETEISEAINSMFEWYRNAELCIAYLADVETGNELTSFENSEWFKRGWTLQELLAPRLVVFLTYTWQVIGYKGELLYGDRRFDGPNLVRRIASITGISEQILHDYDASHDLNLWDKLRWLEGRQTTVSEDTSYALYGILGVSIGANYGEGQDGARRRLLAELHRQGMLREIKNWISPPDIWTNHETARQLYEPDTGVWLLQHSQYQAWKSGSAQFLWIYGKAGCGKTVLCSTIVEDLKKHCDAGENLGLGVFYFSFSDRQKQSYDNLLRSLITQLALREPGLSLLQQAYEKPNQSVPGADELEQILLSSLMSYDKVFLALDALDECLEDSDTPHTMLDRLKKLAINTTKVKMLATSRNRPDVLELMETLQAGRILVSTSSVDEDIKKYVAVELSRDPKLSQLDLNTTIAIEEVIGSKVDGMFRWAYCQIQELKKLKVPSPRNVRKALRMLPATLDHTYERVLCQIDEASRKDVQTLLRWLAYARLPLTLGQLAEAVVVDPTTGDGEVDVNDRSGFADVLELLPGLVVTLGVGEDEGNNDGDKLRIQDQSLDSVGIDRDAMDQVLQTPSITRDSTVGLAHFSVKEYLESARILLSSAKDFHLDSAEGHRFITQSCLTYIGYYSNDEAKTSTKEDLIKYPLLEYAAQSWYYHAALQQCDNVDREVSFLLSDIWREDWLLVHQPDRVHKQPFEQATHTGSGLYYGSYVGLEKVVKMLLSLGEDANARGGFYGNALQAASVSGHTKVVKMLLDHGADVNARGFYSNALQAASVSDHAKVVEMLLDHGADVNARGFYGNALQAASFWGHDMVVEMLLDHGADINARGGEYGNALHAASFGGHKMVVKLLLDHGADVKATGAKYGNALHAASSKGRTDVVELLLKNGAFADKQSLLQQKSEDSDDLSSIASIESRIDGMWSSNESLSSNSSAHGEYAGRVDLFVRVTLQDKDLCTLLTQAIQRMSSDRFIRNHRRLLRGFHFELNSYAQTELERTASSLLKSRATREAISRQIYGSLTSVEVFQKLRARAQSESNLNLIERMLQQTQSAAEMTANTSLQSQEKESYPNRNSVDSPSEASGSSNSGDSEGSQGEHVDDEQLSGGMNTLELAKNFLFSGAAFERYKSSVRRFVGSPSTSLLKSLVLHGDVAGVQELLEQHFEAVACAEFSWLKELIEIGYDCREIAELLVDVESDTPWLFFEPSSIQDFSLDPQLHLKACVHHPSQALENCGEGASARSWLKTENDMDPQLHDRVRRLLSELCGLAGVIPHSRDIAVWDGQVTFQHQDDVRTATVSYFKDTSPVDPSGSLRERLSRIGERFRNAFGMLQSNKVCCNSFTLLRWANSNTTTPPVELRRIDASSVINLLDAINAIGDNHDGLQQLAAYAENIIVEVADVELARPPSDLADGELLLDHALHLTSLAVQILCLALLSYGRGHTGEFCPFFLVQPVRRIVLQGSRQSPEVATIIAEPFALTCIGDMIQGEGVVFRSAAVPLPLHDRLRHNVLGTPEDVIDTWGPGTLITNSSLLGNGEVVRAEIRGGTLDMAPLAQSLSPMLHWERFHSDLGPTASHLQFEEFSLRRKAIIGMLQVNSACPLGVAESESNIRRLCQANLHLVGTTPAVWHHKSTQVGTQIGQYVAITVGVELEKREGVTAKARIIQRLESIRPRISLQDLDAHYGLQISLCTGLARRVSLRLLLADVLIPYVENNLPRPPGWDQIREELVDALRGPNFCGWLEGKDIEDKQQVVIDTLGDLLRHLKFTGLDQRFTLNVAWIRPGEDQLCFKLQCNDYNLWARILEDTEHCATFACITTECLEGDGHKCRRSQISGWQNVSKLLSTEICPCATANSNLTMQGPSLFTLRDKIRYWIGPVDSGLVASAAVEGPLKQPVLEVTRNWTGLVPPKICDRVLKIQKAARERIRERGAVGGHTISVTVRAKSA